MFHVESQNVARNTKIQIWTKIVKNERKKNSEISRFLRTSSTSNSESMASIQVSVHIHLYMLAVNGSSKGQPWIGYTVRT